MNCMNTEGTMAYLSSARQRLCEAAALLTEAGIKSDDPSFVLIDAADMAIAELQPDVSFTSSPQVGTPRE